jgi:hypothetical protein
VFERVRAEANGDGFYFFRASSTSSKGIVAAGNLRAGVAIAAESYPLYADGSPARHTIEDASLTANATGLDIRIADYYEFDVRTGANVWGCFEASAHVALSGSTVTGNAGDGVRLVSERCGEAGTGGLTLSGNVLADNGQWGIVARRNWIPSPYPPPAIVPLAVLLDANTLARNGAGGVSQQTDALVRTRGNNAIVQSTPVAGILTPVPAY